MREKIKQIKEAVELAGFERYNTRYFKEYNDYEFSIVFYKNFAVVNVYNLIIDSEEVEISFNVDNLDRLKASIYGITGQKL